MYLAFQIWCHWNHHSYILIDVEKIAWDQAAWSETAKTEPDFLNLDEFLSFRHPESSSSSLLSKADDIIGEYGKKNNS